jgi:hypothetical protein
MQPMRHLGARLMFSPIKSNLKGQKKKRLNDFSLSKKHAMKKKMLVT